MAHLEGVLNCIICQETVTDAHICPNCSKMCCLECIRKWLLVQRSCPHCRGNLDMTELVKCRWIEEVIQKIGSLKITQANNICETCEIHNEKLSVFCNDCNQCICSHCALWAENHLGHSFKPLDDVYGQHLLKIKEECYLITNWIKDLRHLIRNVENNVLKIKAAKDISVQELRSSVDGIMDRLDQEMKDKLLTLSVKKNSLTQECKHVECLLRTAKEHTEQYSKSEFIRHSPEVLRMFTNIQRRPISNLISSPVHSEFANEIVPPYNCHSYKMYCYSELLHNSEVVYSSPLQACGLTWRLKVYPQGNGTVRGNYLSVFLELCEGFPQKSKYEYKIELVNQTVTDDSKNVVRASSSEFEVGECWGYNRFFRLDLLASEGFINTDSDSLMLKLYVRSQTYYQAFRDLKWSVSTKTRLPSSNVNQSSMLDNFNLLPVKKSNIDSEDEDSQNETLSMSDCSSDFNLEPKQDLGKENKEIRESNAISPSPLPNESTLLRILKHEGSKIEFPSLETRFREFINDFTSTQKDIVEEIKLNLDAESN